VTQFDYYNSNNL